MIDSFQRHHMEQILYLEDHPFSPRQLAELVWTLSHRNDPGVPGRRAEERWFRLRFEDLVTDPIGRDGGPVPEPRASHSIQLSRSRTRQLDAKMVDGVYPESAPWATRASSRMAGSTRRGRRRQSDPGRRCRSARRPGRSRPCLAMTCRPTGPPDRRTRRDALARQQRAAQIEPGSGNDWRAEDRELIAIVGMAGRFPGAADVDQFWANLRDGVESIRAVHGRGARRCRRRSRSEPGFVNAGSVMDGIDQFDAAFFGMSRREAELTDPQHRVFLEWPGRRWSTPATTRRAYDGRIGVFGGVAANTYFRNNVVGHAGSAGQDGDYPLLLATEREYAITRVAYKLGLKGPAISLNTACSTSAVAVHLAVQSLLLGRVRPGARRGPAGSASRQRPGYVYQEDGILSPDGHCRTFDADARGTVVASGAAVVVLKRLSEAVRDGDTIYAVIRGSAVNNDGSAKIGYTAPSIEGQAAVIEEALAVAEVDADTIGIRRGPRHRDVARRPDRGRGADPGLPPRHEPTPVLRDRLPQDQHRPPRCGGGRRRAHQGGARAAPRA